MEPPTLSVVIPAYNEAASMTAIVERVRECGLASQIVVVDDGSTDGTRELLVRLQERIPIELILHERNSGKGASVATGFRRANGTFVIVQDADLEYDPRDYALLYEQVAKGKAAVVYGSRFLNRWPSPWWHTLGNRVLTWFSNLMTGLHLTDMETCYKMLPTELVRRMPLRCRRFGFEPEITVRLANRGIPIAEVPIRFQRRGYAQGKKIGMWDAVKTVAAILLYRMTK